MWKEQANKDSVEGADRREPEGREMVWAWKRVGGIYIIWYGWMFKFEQDERE